MPRVVGTDPGTSSLDLILLVDGDVADQRRIELGHADEFASALDAWRPIDLVAGPSGYGLPLVRGAELTAHLRDLMALVRPDERDRRVGIADFRRWVSILVASRLPCIFLPGGIHLPTIPVHRKANTIDMGTPDKVAVAALAMRHHISTLEQSFDSATFAVVEVGSAFTAVLVVERGAIVDAAAGTRGPIGARSSGAWDGEAAYALSPLAKDDLYRGGLIDLGDDGPPAFRESLRKHVAGLWAVTPFENVYLSGARAELALGVLDDLAEVRPLPNLPGAWVKHAAQGAALLADGLAGGRCAPIVEALALRRASGTIGDTLRIRGGPVPPHPPPNPEPCP
jgi:predicted butyrate kinase (DUF1464 family)